MNNKNFAIFASGNGTNAEVLAKHALDKNYPLKFVFTDKENAGVRHRMEKMAIECICIEKKEKSKPEYEQKIIELVQEYSVNWIFLAGYMKILSPAFLEKFYDETLNLNRVLNIHPSLLPSFPGKDGYGDAFKYGVAVSGVSVHFVDEGVDSGPILLQESFDRIKTDSLESFIVKGRAIEHRIYPTALDIVMNNEIDVFKRLL